jgi:uncharacterized protein (DUF1015 family)
VFVLYADPEQALAPFLGQMDACPPDMQMTTFDGVLQRVWRVPQDDTVTAFFRGQTLYIADGHHRFRTAMVYRDMMRAKEQPDGPRPYDYIMMGFVSFSDPGLQIDPPHRLVPMPEDFSAIAFLDALAPWFEVEPVTADLPARLTAQPGCAFGLAIRGHGEYLLTLRDIDRVAMLGDDHGAAWRNLDIAVLHRGIIERLLGLPADTQFAYVHNAEKALEFVRNAESGLAFLVKPVHPKEVRACAEDGDPMPQKATYFFPKLPTGAALHRLA